MLKKEENILDVVVAISFGCILKIIVISTKFFRAVADN
jgi:hypothetical protein